jgi:hypothetical protein
MAEGDGTTTTDTTTTEQQASGEERQDEGGEERKDGGDELSQLRAAIADERKRREKAQRELDDLRKTKMTDDERALAEAEERGAARVRAELAQRMLEAEVRGLAAPRLADPQDAVRLLDLGELLDGDGTYDRGQIEAALDELVKAKPYLARGASNGAAARVPPGARDSGGTGQSADDFLRQMVRGRK